MAAVIGRNGEKQLLEDALKSKDSSLIAVYGRRRVGKTFLIRELYKDYICFEVTGLHNGTMPDQLENFTNILSGYQKKKTSLPLPDSWLAAFLMLQKYLDRLKSNKKKVIFIDEFPWMATRRSKFLMAFEHFWNAYAVKRKDLVVVICGSSASYMIQNIIRNKGGLHNRISQKIRLLPFTLNETEQFLKSRHINFSHYDILQLYMSLGGIPHYLEKIKKGESVVQVIDRLCFSKDGFLREEYDNLFTSLFEKAETHQAIVEALSKVRKGITRNKLLAITGLPTGGTFSKITDELIESGFITQYLPFKGNAKQSLYRLSDEYSMFYLKFMQGAKSLGKGTWLRLFNSRNYVAWSGFSFETICLKHIQQIKSALRVAAVYSENSSWISRNENEGTQIDLLIDRDDNVINICEMKFSKDIFIIDKAYSLALKNKMSVFRKETQTNKNIHLTFVTTYGVKDNSYALEIVQNAIAIDQLFANNSDL